MKAETLLGMHMRLLIMSDRANREGNGCRVAYTVNDQLLLPCMKSEAN